MLSLQAKHWLTHCNDKIKLHKAFSVTGCHTCRTVVRSKLAAVGKRRILTILHKDYAAFIRAHCGGDDGTLPRVPIYRVLTFDSFRTKQMDGKCRACEGYHLKWVCANAVSGGCPCAHVTAGIGYHGETHPELGGVLPTVCDSMDCDTQTKSCCSRRTARCTRPPR